MIVLWLILHVLANARAAEKPKDLDRFWQQALVRLQSWPADPEWQSTFLTFAGPGLVPCQVRCRLQPDSALPPVLYILDRQYGETFDPGDTHSWLVLDLRAMAQAAAATGPDPTLQPTYRGVLLAQRALALLLDKCAPGQVRAGLVGEGSGGAVALALAALRPAEVAFVAAHRPVQAPAQPYLDPSALADKVRCPALISYGLNDSLAPPDQVIALFDDLRCDKEIVEMPRARHCQPEDLRNWSKVWRAWAGEVLGVSDASPSPTVSVTGS